MAEVPSTVCGEFTHSVYITLTHQTWTILKLLSVARLFIRTQVHHVYLSHACVHATSASAVCVHLNQLTKLIAFKMLFMLLAILA